jgi:hypothetical protein
MRRYMTDYAGFWRGYCKTRESAIIAAIKRVVQDGGNRATITDRETNQDIVWITLSKDRKQAVIDTARPLRKGIRK